ncbi:MAG: SDR family oxidoreductase [Clostridiales bacterium]|nr:SDR family oxidoreductase [Clostridiales bacterium]
MQLPKLPKNARVLVTGGAGFIGSNLVETLLQEGYFVRCLDNFSTGKRENIAAFTAHPQFALMEGDIRDFETCRRACEGMDYVSHQAAWGSVPRSVQLPLLYEEINIRGTLHMLEAAREAGVKRFVYASSSSVYGDAPKLPKREGEEGRLLSPYAVTKRVNEEYARQYTLHYGLETVGLRYFNVFGQRQDPAGAYAAVIPKFIAQLLRGETPTIDGDGTQSRDFTYVDNAVQANLAALTAPASACGHAYNIACGGRETLLSVYAGICKALGVNTTPRFGPPRAGDIPHSNADIAKAKETLGYDPIFGFAEGMERAIAWYRGDM